MIIQCKCTAIIILLIFQAIYSQERMKKWEELGITSKEYKLSIDNNISEEKIKDIISIGVTITEYVKKPWVELNIKEKQWYELLRNGYTKEDIKKKVEQDRLKKHKVKRFFLWLRYKRKTK